MKLLENLIAATGWLKRMKVSKGLSFFLVTAVSALEVQAGLKQISRRDSVAEHIGW